MPKLRGATLANALLAVILFAYVVSWFYLVELRWARPMANLAYFYYGNAHQPSDRILYVLYLPLYWGEVELHGSSRYGIHWSDRWGPRDLGRFRKAGLSNEELMRIGFPSELLGGKGAQ